MNHDTLTRKGSSIVWPPLAIRNQGQDCSALARHTDPATSHAAARAIAPAADRLGAAILAALQPNVLGLTARGITKETGIDYASVTPRMKPLEAAGYVVRGSRPRVEFNRRPSTVWLLTGKGAVHLAERQAKKPPEPA